MTRKPGRPRAAKRKVNKKPATQWIIAKQGQYFGQTIHKDLVKDIYSPLVLRALAAAPPYTSQRGPMSSAMDYAHPDR